MENIEYNLVCRIERYIELFTITGKYIHNIVKQRPFHIQNIIDVSKRIEIHLIK